MNRYWTLTPAGAWTFTSYSATFTYVDADVDGIADESNFAVRKLASGTWNSPPGGSTPNAAGNTTAGADFTAFSDYAIGEAAGVQQGILRVTKVLPNNSGGTTTCDQYSFTIDADARTVSVAAAPVTTRAPTSRSLAARSSASMSTSAAL